jgi:hypothetical protein
MLFLEGAISENAWGGTTFTRIKAPSHDDNVIFTNSMISSPETIFVCGMISTFFAGFLQLIDPGQKQQHHMSVKRSLQAIHGAVLYSDMKIQKAEQLRALASLDPNVVLAKMREEIV